MKKSKFQIKNPRLLKLFFSVNENFNKDKFIGLDIDSKTTIKRAEKSATVRLELNIFKEGENKEAPFSIDIIMEADFKWDESVSGKDLEYLLNSNAPAVLLSYMRPYIINTTVGSGFPPLVLPLMDFRENKVVHEETL